MSNASWSITASAYQSHYSAVDTASILYVKVQSFPQPVRETHLATACPHRRPSSLLVIFLNSNLLHQSFSSISNGRYIPQRCSTYFPTSRATLIKLNCWSLLTTTYATGMAVRWDSGTVQCLFGSLANLSGETTFRTFFRPFYSHVIDDFDDVFCSLTLLECRALKMRTLNGGSGCDAKRDG